MTLALESLSATRGGRVLFEDVSLTLKPGQRLLITGPNGVGKTTLLETMAGLAPKAKGRVLWDGAPLSCQNACYVGVRRGLKAHLTPKDHLSFWHTLSGVRAPLQSTHFEALGLDRVWHVPVGTLSFGMQQRVGLARLLLTRADVWLLDEPLVGLDVSTQEILLRALALQEEKGGVTALVSHTPLQACAHLALETFVPSKAGLYARLKQESDDVALFC
ncbi:MAG: heme ABC exporter ATP-binding protein CcmA [Candidatus Puniceispirillum sp.]|nr:heme ABC exporter ATP-binding protein CcmA [Candidatus Puniceispirillum sp.]